MKKADKLKKDLTALSLISSSVLDLEMKFLEKDGVFHTRLKRNMSNSRGRACPFGGDSSLTVTKPLNVLKSLDEVCPRCIDFLSFNTYASSVLVDLIDEFRELLFADKYITSAENVIETSIEKGPEGFNTYMNSANANLRFVLNNKVKFKAPSYPNHSTLKPYVSLFIDLYEITLQRFEKVNKDFKDFIFSDSNEKEFLTGLVKKLLPIPDVCKRNSSVKKLVTEIENSRTALLQDSGWSLFLLDMEIIKYYGNEPGVILLGKYATQHKGLFYAPQIYLDYVLMFFGPTYIRDSARFNERLNEAVFENIIGIYTPGTSGHNSSLKNVLTVAKII